MKRDEIAKLIEQVEDHYDIAFDADRTKRFFRSLTDRDADAITSAADQWFETEKYPPRPADLIRTHRAPIANRNRTEGGERDPWCPFGKFTNELGEECVQFPDGPSGCWSKPVSMLADYDWRIITSLLQDDIRTLKERTP